MAAMEAHGLTSVYDVADYEQSLVHLGIQTAHTVRFERRAVGARADKRSPGRASVVESYYSLV